MNVFDSAVKTLGPPPIPFTVLGLGSTARGEASPYSDLEFGILLQGQPSEGEKAYFTEWTQRVRDQIAAVGEHASRYNPEGFHFDDKLSPLYTSDGKTPFMGTADELVDAFQRDGGDWEKTALINAEWLYGSDVSRNDAGGWTEPNESWQALQNFHETVVDRLNGEDGSGVISGQELANWTFDLARDMGSDGLKSLPEGVVDVKALARLPMLLVQGLAVQHGLLLEPQTKVAANSIDQRLDLLVQAGRISREDADTILDLQDGLSKLRVRSHLENGEQVDKVALTMEAAQREGLLFDPGLTKLAEDAQALSERVGTIGLNPRTPTFSQR
jgi:Putative nucleotidyltransferase DUF294